MDLHQKHLDELPAAQFGWNWLGDVGRAGGADQVVTAQFPKLGGIATAWRGSDLVCYFVVARDGYNWTDIHCGLAATCEVMQRHPTPELADAAGAAWLRQLATKREPDTVDENRNDEGAMICTAWCGRRLVGYYLFIRSPADTVLICQELPPLETAKAQDKPGLCVSGGG